MLSNRLFSTLRERQLWVRKLIARRYRKVLRMPTWTQAELEELGPTSRQEVESIMRLQQSVKSRLRCPLVPVKGAEFLSEAFELCKDFAQRGADTTRIGSEEWNERVEDRDSAPEQPFSALASPLGIRIHCMVCGSIAWIGTTTIDEWAHKHACCATDPL